MLAPVRRNHHRRQVPKSRKIEHIVMGLQGRTCLDGQDRSVIPRVPKEPRPRGGAAGCLGKSKAPIDMHNHAMPDAAGQAPIGHSNPVSIFCPRRRPPLRNRGSAVATPMPSQPDQDPTDAGTALRHANQAEAAPSLFRTWHNDLWSNFRIYRLMARVCWPGTTAVLMPFAPPRIHPKSPPDRAVARP